MIDDPLEVQRVLGLMRQALPMPARMTARLMAALAEQAEGAPRSATCRITKIDHAGDEAGIICYLECDADPDSKRVIVSSLTHLEVGGATPCARAAETYRKRRIKRLRRQDQRAAWEGGT